MQYTIEARQLGNGEHPSSNGTESRCLIVEARDPDDAISQFVQENRSELVSVTRPNAGRESIATIREGDAVFLVRIYEN